MVIVLTPWKWISQMGLYRSRKGAGHVTVSFVWRHTSFSLPVISSLLIHWLLFLWMPLNVEAPQGSVVGFLSFSMHSVGQGWQMSSISRCLELLPGAAGWGRPAGWLCLPWQQAWGVAALCQAPTVLSRLGSHTLYTYPWLSVHMFSGWYLKPRMHRRE